MYNAARSDRATVSAMVLRQGIGPPKPDPTGGTSSMSDTTRKPRRLRRGALALTGLALLLATTAGDRDRFRPRQLPRLRPPVPLRRPRRRLGPPVTSQRLGTPIAAQRLPGARHRLLDRPGRSAAAADQRPQDQPQPGRRLDLRRPENHHGGDSRTAGPGDRRQPGQADLLPAGRPPLPGDRFPRPAVPGPAGPHLRRRPEHRRSRSQQRRGRDPQQPLPADRNRLGRQRPDRRPA